MTTPTPSASGAHTRIQLKRPDFVIVVHATLESFSPTSGNFSAWLDTQSAGAAAEVFDLINGQYVDSSGNVWEVVR